MNLWARFSSMRSSRRKLIKASLLVPLISSIGIFVSHIMQEAVKITVDFSAPDNESRFSTAITYVNGTVNTPFENQNRLRVQGVQPLIKAAMDYENTSIMGWGVADPWPDPSQMEPTNWNSLDSRLQTVIDTGGVPVITLCEAPWWMKGQLQSDGSTRLMTQADEWSDVAYDTRILDNEMDAWLHLVQRVAERYMVSPYHVRYFQVWNELKGYYNPLTNGYDYTTSDGDPSGPNARHGYTHMYNQVYERIMQVAGSLGIPEESVKVGGPYIVMDTWSSTKQSDPSTITKAYGTYDQRPLDVVKYWLQHKAGAAFIALDGANRNKDQVNITDPFTASEKFADITRWVRSLDTNNYPGAATLPIWWAEWYASPYTAISDDNYNNAIKSYALVKLVKAGGATALSWGGTGEGTVSTGIWSIRSAGEVDPLPWYYSLKALREHFPPGTRLYKTTVSSPASIEVLASTTTIMLINKTAARITATLNGSIVFLTPYQVSILNW